MLAQLFKIFLGILALMSAGAISYTYLERTVGPRETPTIAEQTQTHAELIPQKSVPPPHVSVSVSRKSAIVTNGALVPKTVAVSKTVVAPGPLRAATTTTVSFSSDLSARGIIDDTNIARTQNGGLSALAENYTLDRDAQLKLADMFAKQYFEHVSPTGAGPADLAKTVGYAYVIVGENLALGDFGSDSGVVTAWMGSPGHRANILNAHYQEIGVAVGKGMYEGHMTWIAVQSFGMPLSSCPTINVNLKAQIDANNVTIATLRAELDAKKAQIDATPTNDPSYNVYVNEFNAVVPEYNAFVETNRANVATYNARVQAFNDCIGAVSATTAR